MHTVVNHLHLDGPVEDFVPSLEAEGLPLLATMPGFHSFYFVKEAADRAIVIIMWDSLEEAAAGAKQFGSTWFAQNIAPHLASEQQRTVGEVLAHIGVED